MYGEGNGLNINSIEMLEYIEMDTIDENNRIFSNNLPSRQRAFNSYVENKIKIKATLATIRLIMLYFFYYVDGGTVTIFLKSLIGFLLIHEALIISNYLIMCGYFLAKRFLNGNLNTFPAFFSYVDILCNFIFFTWFVYGNLCILTDREGVEESLMKNNLLTYYISVLILLGFFIYSKILFYIIFFISFCPCITYVVCSDLHTEYQHRRRARRLQEKLIEEAYADYVARLGQDIEMCIICTNEFNPKERIICLPCNNKHVFHADCIRQWIDKKTICPLCRIDLNSEEQNNSNSNANYVQL